MRFMDASNVMVPVAAYSGLAASDVLSQSNGKLPFTLSSCDPHLRSQNGLKNIYQGPGIPPPAHLLSENSCTFQPWVQPAKGTSYSPNAKRKDVQSSNINLKLPEDSFSKFKDNSFAEENSNSVFQFNRNCINALSQSYFPSRLSDVPMNGAEKLTMTGNSNPHSDQLNWLSEVASAAAKGTLNKHVSSPNQNEQPVALPPPVLHTVGDVPSQLLLSSSGSVFSPPIFVARASSGGANSLRMFSPPFQIERTRHVQHASISGSGTMYYSQASRTAPAPSFFQATSYPVTATLSSGTNCSINNPDSSRSYLQVNNYSSLPATHVVSSSQLPCSPSYLQHSPSTASPTNLVVPSSHARMFQQGRSILISRSPEAMIVHSPHEKDPQCHVQIQLSPTLPISQEEANHRKSYSSNDLALGSSSCSPVIENAQSASHGTEFSVGQQRTSPSHVGYRLPTGKEGSLKHRILRPPSINILEPPHSVVADAPLSAPPIRTHREPSPKQARSIPSSGYRSFSSSASSITEVSNRVVASPAGSFPNNCSSYSSECPSPAPLNSPGGAAAQLKYPQSFMKGSIIQLANNKLKQVEDMTTEDFIECGLLSSTLKIDSSTVVSIEKTPFTGAAKLGFHVGQDNIQITVEAPLEHPFFVYKQGWSSCSPERSAQRYGLTCHKLKVGDVCISLTDKPKTDANVRQKVTNLSVPSVNASDSNQNMCADRTVKTKEGAPDVAQLPSNVNSDKLTNTIQSDSNQVSSGKRKRRWSAPDNLSQNEDGVQSS